MTKSYTNPFFGNKPALKALKDVYEPKPEHVRACLLELCWHLIKKEPEPHNPYASKAEVGNVEFDLSNFHNRPDYNEMDFEDSLLQAYCQGIRDCMIRMGYNIAADSIDDEKEKFTVFATKLKKEQP